MSFSLSVLYTHSISSASSSSSSSIITLEDVLEALLQEQIYDEMDAAGRKSQHIYDEDNVLDKFPYQVYSINTIQEVDSHSSYHLQEDDTSHKGSSSGQIV